MSQNPLGYKPNVISTIVDVYGFGVILPWAISQM